MLQRFSRLQTLTANMKKTYVSHVTQGTRALWAEVHCLIIIRILDIEDFAEGVSVIYLLCFSSPVCRIHCVGDIFQFLSLNLLFLSIFSDCQQLIQPMITLGFTHSLT